MFQTITEVFILVPALVGLKGNLEMTLASRLSTAVSVNKVVVVVVCVWGGEGIAGDIRTFCFYITTPRI